MAARPSRSGLWAAAVLALSPAPALAVAGEGAPLGARLALVEVAFRLSRLDYEERGTRGTFLDGEEGQVPAVAGAFELHGGPLSLRCAAAYGSGTLDYVGLVQSANASVAGLEARSRSDARLLELEGQLAFALPRARGVALVAGAGRRRWRREIRDTTVVSRAGATVPVRGLSERYAWDELHAGVRLPLVRGAAAAWDLEASVTGTVNPVVAVDWNGRWVELPAGARTGFRGGTTLRVALGPALFLRAALALERLELGESSRDPATGLVEPWSRTWTGALELGLGARL